MQSRDLGDVARGVSMLWVVFLIRNWFFAAFVCLQVPDGNARMRRTIVVGCVLEGIEIICYVDASFEFVREQCTDVMLHGRCCVAVLCTLFFTPQMSIYSQLHVQARNVTS